MRQVFCRFMFASLLGLACSPSFAQAPNGYAAAKEINFNGVRLGTALSEFTARSDAYSCATNGGRAASCRVFTVLDNRCTRDSVGREFCGKVELARAPDLVQKWRYFLGFKVNVGRTRLNFLDGKLVSLSTVPADDYNLLYEAIVAEFGRPKEVARRQHFFAEWQQAVGEREFRMFLTNHPSDPYLSMFDRDGSNEFGAEVKRSPLGLFSEATPLTTTSSEGNNSSGNASSTPVRQPTGMDAEACERAKIGCRSKENPVLTRSCLNALAVARGCR